MKQPTGNASTLFCEQVSTVTVLFEKWNDCERAVVMYALLKRLSYPTLKFLQFSIESNLTQNFGSQKNLNSIETNANDAMHLQKLVNTYKSFSIAELTQIADKDSILFESDLILKDVDKNYSKKEDVLHDILNMIPVLKPGNDEAKKVYLSLIPLAVEDTVRQLVAAELVQQIFSYLLIHPAISNDDRRSLSHWLRHLEDHIQSSFSSGQRSFYILTNTNESPSESLNASFSSMNGNNNQNAWQAIAPPSNKPQTQQQQHFQPTQQLSNMTLSSLNSASSTSSSDWNLNILHLPPAGSIPNPPPTSSQNSLGIVTIESNEADISVEDTHISFSKNGTEVLDFDDNSDEGGNCNTQLAYIGDHLHVPTFGNFDNPSLTLKTRRSNSLTTPSSSSPKAAEKSARDNACSNSTENLAQFAQKPRSFSLSIETPRNSLQSSGSETRLDELKPNYLKFTTQNVGMSNIGQWLKSLRLHKYVGLFTNMAYEDMMQITEEFLQGLGVTKGASHKLSICIEKLKSRYETLSTMEVQLLENNFAINVAIEELANMVLTPMKPVDSGPNNDNVAGKFLHVLEILCQIVIKREITSSHDEECVNGLLWILERALHNEAFMLHTNQLKECKFKLSKLKMQFMPKSHHTKSGNVNPGVNKPRWSNSKTRKPENSTIKSTSSDRIHRKNSSDISSFPMITLQKQPSNLALLTSNNNQHYQQSDAEKFQSSAQQRHQQQQQLQGGQSQYYSANNMNCPPPPNTTAPPSAVIAPSSNHQYKSASYPSFSSAVANGLKPMHPQPRPEQQQPQHNQPPHPQPNQPYRHHHRHSLNNLIVLSNPQKQQVTTFGKSKPSVGTLTLNNKTMRPAAAAPLSQASLVNSKSSNQTQSQSLKPMPFSFSQKSILNNNNTCGPNQLKDDATERLGKKTTTTLKSSAAGDINSSLEFLCLQMTEQAIN